MEPDVTWDQVEALRDEAQLVRLLPYVRQIKAHQFCIHLKKLWVEGESGNLVDILLRWDTTPESLLGSLLFKYQVFKKLLIENHQQVEKKERLRRRRDKSETENDAEKDDGTELDDDTETEDDAEAEDNVAATFDFEEAASKIVQFSPDLLKYEFRSTELTVIDIAARYGSRKLFRTLMDIARESGDTSGTQYFGRQTWRGRSPLRNAVLRRDLSSAWDILGLIDDMLAFIDEVQIDEQIVDRAIENGKPELARIFIRRRPKFVTQHVVTYAIHHKDDEMLSDLLTNCKSLFYGNGLLHLAIAVGDTRVVDKMLERCPELAIEVDRKGEPPMKYISKIIDKATREELRQSLVPFVVRHVGTQLPSPHNSDLDPASTPISVIEQIRSLLGDPQDNRREITLDLGGFRHSRKSIEPFLALINKASQASTLKSRSGTPTLRVDFESTLRYVDIPVPDLPPASRDSGMITIRSEVEEILDWLRNKNGVTGIHELRVTDSLYIPHSEEVIKKCLTGFDIEILDWKRVDLSIETLFSESRLICPNLKKLTLYASGWIALQYWTSQEVQKSLRKFPKLREVQVVIEQDLIGYALSEEYEERCMSNFERTLAALGQRQDFIFSVLRDIWAVSPAKEAELHGPRKCTAVEVTRLGGFLDAYQILQRQFLDENWRAQFLKDANPSYMPHIKVAVIDTGVDPGSIQCSHIQGSSFVSSGSGESPWWFSQHPHGTQMAKIITELDPFCQLLVAKVGDYSTDMTGERVKKAFEWAVMLGADIISISAAFFNKIDDLDLEISRAMRAGTVVIASTAGEGYNQANAYPADYDLVLKIAATTDMGKEAQESVKRNADFLFPGQNLVAETTFLGSDNWPHEVSGASVATAIAAGVASLVLACHRLALSTRTAKDRWERHNHFKRDIIIKAFKEMWDEDARYVRPWIFFHERDTQRSWGEAGSILAWIRDKYEELDRS